MAKSETIKFTEDEVKSLQELSTDYQQVFSDIGKNRINKLRLQKQQRVNLHQIVNFFP